MYHVQQLERAAVERRELKAPQTATGMHTFIGLVEVAAFSSWLHTLRCLVLKLAALAMGMPADCTSLVAPGCVKRTQGLGLLAAGAKLVSCKGPVHIISMIRRCNQMAMQVAQAFLANT